MTIAYAREETLSLKEFIAVLESSSLAERRPMHDPARLQRMLDGASLIVTARDETGKLVGIARSITDWCYALYCSELAVDKARQGLGIGKKLLEETVRHAPDVKNYLLLSAPGAVSFYEHAGYDRHPDAFLFHHNDI